MPANVQTMFSASGMVPWHKKGVILNDAPTSEQAIIKAGLDWTVSKRTIYVEQETEARDRFSPNIIEKVPQSDFFAITRDDNNVTLGIVGPQQAVLQNRNAFRLLDELIGSGCRFETAGALGKGERVWMLVKMPGYLRIGKDDEIEKYLLCAHGHDGSMAFYIFETGVRVVCQNTLTMALQQRKGTGVKIKHTINAMKNLTVENLRERLGYAENHYLMMEDLSKRLAAKQMNREKLRTFLETIYPKPEDGYSTKTQNMLDEIERLFDGGQRGAELETVRGTAWGAFNAVAEYVDFHRPSKTTRNNSEDQNRTASILFGSARDIKQKAWAAALSV